jgi:phage tail sheath protein FI
MAFLHGIETRFEERLGQAFNQPETATIGLVGTAPKGATNTLTTVNNRREAIELFGEQLDGFTIPYALEAIFQQGGARVVVVNVFDPASHNVAVADESIVVADARGATANHPTTAVVVTNQAGDTTYVEGTDYRIDAFGNIRVLDGTAIANGDTILVSYSYFDPTSVVDVEVVGTISPARTGLELLDSALPQLGYEPKIIIVPGLGETDLTTAKMAEKAEQFKGVYIVDAPLASTVTTVIQGRGPLGGIPGFRGDDKNLIPAFPYVKTLDSRGNTVDRPLGPFVAGLISKSDAEFGVQRSPSNQVLTGVSGTSVEFSASYSDPSSEINLLNEVGVISVFNARRRGYLLWGNRNASAPDNTEPDVFISVHRVRLTITQALEQNMIRYVDSPITQALIDAIRESGNAYLRGLIQEGALLGGEVTYDPNNNPVSELQQGRLRFEVTILPPSPAERLTFVLSFNPEYAEVLN